MNIPQTLMILGIVLLVVGILWQFTPLGKLPGDIVIKKESTTFYFPIATSIVLSIILSLIFWLIRR